MKNSIDTKQCALYESCRVAKEGKTHKKFTRAAECRVCKKLFHSFCINYENKTEAEFDSIKELFLCTQCYSLVDVISDKLYDRVSVDLNNIRAQLQKLTNIFAVFTTDNNKQNNKEFNEACVVDKTCNIDIDKSESDNLNNSAATKPIIANNSLCTSSIITTQNEERVFDVKNCGSNNAIIANVDNNSTKQVADDALIVKTNGTTITEGATIEPNTLPVIKSTAIQEVSSSHTTSCKTLTYYLCSVENVLSIDEVLLILADANIPTSGIQITEAEGSFKNKKFLVISSDESVKLFNFKLRFNESKLNGTWFLRITPPKPKIIQAKIEQNYHRVENNNMHKEIKPKQYTRANTQKIRPQNSFHATSYTKINQKNIPHPIYAYKNTPLQSTSSTNYWQKDKIDYPSHLNNNNVPSTEKSSVSHMDNNNLVSFLENLLNVARKT